MQVGALGVVTVSCVRNLFAIIPSSGYFKMDDAKERQGQPEKLCRGSLLLTSMLFRGSNNTSRSEAGIASMLYG